MTEAKSKNSPRLPGFHLIQSNIGSHNNALLAIDHADVRCQMSDVSGILQSDCTLELDTIQNADHSLSSQVQSTLGIHYLDGFEGEYMCC